MLKIDASLEYEYADGTRETLGISGDASVVLFNLATLLKRVKKFKFSGKLSGGED